jgi:hypothetical protein
MKRRQKQITVEKLCLMLMVKAVEQIEKGPKRPKREQVVAALRSCFVENGWFVALDGRYYWVEKGEVLQSDDGVAWHLPSPRAFA